MAKLNFVKKARKTIYAEGKVVQHEITRGKNKGKVVEKRNRTIPRDKQDKILIEKGTSYYHWTFRFGPTHISKERPRRSQLTQSSFLGQIYDLEDDMENYEATEISEDVISEWISTLEQLRDDCQESLDNMPEGLQESSSSGQLLQERIDNLESWISELENVQIDFDEDEARAEAEKEAEEGNANVEILFDDKRQSYFEDIKDEVIDANPGF